MRIRDIGERKARACGALACICDVDGQKTVKMVGCSRCKRGRCRTGGDLEEAATVEMAKPAKQRIALLEMSRLDTLDVGNFGFRVHGSSAIAAGRFGPLLAVRTAAFGDAPARYRETVSSERRSPPVRAWPPRSVRQNEHR